MNEVDFLLSNPFSLLGQSDKERIRELGPHRPKNIKITQPTKSCTRNFDTSYFDTVEWLTASESQQSLHCFYCLLFGDPYSKSKWSKTGFTDISNLTQGIRRHESTKVHIENAIKYQTFGLDLVKIATQLDDRHNHASGSTFRFNEQVRKNRHILSKVIDCIIFCGTHELALQGHDKHDQSWNEGIFLDLLFRDAQADKVLDDHLQPAAIAKYTSNEIQNELLECMFKIYHEEVIKDISSANFLSVQADEVNDGGHLSQLVVIVRYIKDSKAVERFLQFVELQERSSAGLVSTLREVLEPFNAEEKLIAHTCDGAVIMKERISCMQTQMKQCFPNAIFVHCYSHQLNLILKQACSQITACRVFFANVKAFSIFFSHSKRLDFLRCICHKKIPHPSETHWNFQSRLISTISSLKSELQQCFEKIQCEHWDDITTHQAYGLLTLLNNTQFLLFLDFFNKVFCEVDMLYGILQHISTTPESFHHALGKFEKAVQDISEGLCVPSSSQPLNHGEAFKRRRAESDETSIKDACDIIITQILDRFWEQNTIHLLSVIDPSKFQDYDASFPTELIDNVAHTYSMVHKEKLHAELEILYCNETFQSAQCITIQGLYASLKRCGLDKTFSEVCKVIEIALTTPSTLVEAESDRSFSTLKRIQTFSQTTVAQERLNALAFLSVHKDIIDNIPNFINRVIDLFASAKDRKAEFYFK